MEKRFRELFARADAQGCYVFTNFLDLAALNTLHQILPTLARVPFTLFGGAEGCERKILRVGSEELCGYEEPFPIACVMIAPASLRFAEKLTHRDYLGALMNLGIERELLGDIIVREEGAYLFCVERIAPYLAEGITQVRRTTVRCRMLDSVPEGELFKTERMTVQLASVRLDALIGHIYRLSRAEAQALILHGKVFADGRECGDASYSPKNGEIISVRGYGRVRYMGVDSISKKGKCNIAVERYI